MGAVSSTSQKPPQGSTGVPVPEMMDWSNFVQQQEIQRMKEYYETQMKTLDDRYSREKRALADRYRVAKNDMRTLKISNSRLKRDLERRGKELEAAKELKEKCDTDLKSMEKMHEKEKRFLVQRNQELKDCVRAMKKRNMTSEIKMERQNHKKERNALLSQIKELQSVRKNLEGQLKTEDRKHQADMKFSVKEKRQLKKELNAVKVANNKLQKQLESKMKAHEKEKKILLNQNQKLQKEMKVIKTRVPADNVQLAGSRSGPQGETNSGQRLSIDCFHPVRILGEGGFGKVVLARRKAPEGHDQLVAIKALRKANIISHDNVSFTITEKEALILASAHPFVTTLYGCFQTKEHLFLIMEYVSGGNLVSQLQQEDVFSEERARFYAAEITLALEFLHRHGILHRDLKLDNVLIDGDGHCKVADFGLSKLGIFRGNRTDTFCGTPCYMAPEMVRGLPYGHGVDWWALGIILYAMLTGRLPFYDEDEYRLHEMITNDEVIYPSGVSKEAESIMRRLLTKDPSQRLGTYAYGQVYSVREQPFFRRIDWRALQKKRVNPPTRIEVVVEETEESLNFDNVFNPNDATYQNSREEFEGFSYINHGVKK